MEPFGDRVRLIRKSLGLSQDVIPGIDQPRISKIERGREEASADVIDKLAEAFGREPLDLVRGTDREGHYTGQRLRAEQRDELAREKRWTEAADLVHLHILYGRIYNFFDVLYGEHSLVVATQEWLEGRYIELRERCKKAIESVAHIIGPDAYDFYFPDHIVPDGDMDDLVIGSWEFEGAQMKKSLRLLQQALHDYRDCPLDEARVTLEAYLKIDVIDEEIEVLRKTQKEASKDFLRRIEKVAIDPNINSVLRPGPAKPQV